MPTSGCQTSTIRHLVSTAPATLQQDEEEAEQDPTESACTEDMGPRSGTDEQHGYHHPGWRAFVGYCRTRTCREPRLSGAFNASIKSALFKATNSYER